MTQEWLTVQEAQERLNVSRSTLYRWAKRGVLPIYKLGFRTVVKAEDVERMERRASKPRLLYPGAPARYPSEDDLSDIR
jgi:excisionase family DNA binding protein